MPFAELLTAAADGALILTATRRLARHLRLAFDRDRLEGGRIAWRTPAIASADDWLRQAAARLGIAWRLLDGPVGQRLWEDIVEKAESGSSLALLQTGSTARWSEEAHFLLAEYGQDPSALPLTADQVSFLRWRAVYQERCQREGWLDRAALVDRIARGVANRELPTPKAVWLAGFDDLSPGLRLLMRNFAAAGAAVRELPPVSGPPGKLQRLPCADAREEVRRAACWARGLLEAGETDIGIIVPALESYRGLIERIFREEIDPESALQPGGADVRFNLSLGAPLAQTGAVAAALEIIAAGVEMPLKTAGFLLRTPYLGGSLREAVARARLDIRLRGEGKTAVTLAHLQRSAGPLPGRRHQEVRTLPFADICACLLAFARDRERRLPGEWAGIFAHLLQAVGWPGERPLDSNDFQAVKAWREKVLRDMAALDLVSAPLARGEAVALVRRLAAETAFQPEGPESPVQVVGILEAAGLRFGHLWVMGLHDGVLPAPSRPNPFLPVSLQVACGMPHASAEREAEFARKMAARLFSAAPTVVLSHPLREGDSQLLPSPLIGAVPESELPLPPSSAPAVLLRRPAPAAEILIDIAGPPLAPGELPAGGVAILRDQALCPFRAFVRHRLGVAPLESPDIGLDAAVRGNLLHKVMEFFWRRTVDHASLLALDDASLENRLHEAVDAAVAACCPGAFRPQTLLLRQEKDRLFLLAREWLLEVEKKRSPFSVLEEEKGEERNFGGMTIATRVDRVDRLPDGRQIVLDYKTGQVEAADLIGERLLEPQLPVYALGRSTELAGVAFAGVRRGRCCFAGVANGRGLLPRVPAVDEWKKAQDAGIAGWEELLTRWRQQLNELGRAFAAGEAAVDPALPEKKSCGRCEFFPLCRLAETDGPSTGEDE